ncbi:MAG: hypothetical protein HWE11_06495 [Gammaproteobacteria bacterium]|nr:hypothetical protein [Gammaproteobacteria bacterium]
MLGERDVNAAASLLFPAVELSAPTILFTRLKDGAFISGDKPLWLSALAIDDDGSELSADIEFYSNRQGQLTNPARLLPGEHELIASVTGQSGIESLAVVRVYVTRA